MTFEEILDQTLDMLQRRGRVSYRALQRQFHLDDAYLGDLKAEIVEVLRLAVDQDHTMLVWTGDPGAPVAPSPPAAQATAPSVLPPLEAERRQLTIMFCDLVGSTALSTQLDPEDLREVVRAYQTTCAEVIQRFDGHIAQYLGDGLLVYFGYPQAHEDNAQRAVRAGLGIVAAMATCNTHLEQQYQVRLAMRLGIHTGLVVVGEMGGGARREQLALGETPNLAARLEGLAPPDTVVISAATWSLVHAYFTYQDLGTHVLKGVATPVRAYRVLQESGVQSRLDAAVPRGLTPLVGRAHEVALLRERWQRVQQGMGQVVILSGEAGIGKSRLVQRLKDDVAPTPHTRLECRGSPYYQHTALYPVTELFQRALRWQPEDTPHEKLHTLETTLSQYRLGLAETVPLLAPLLALALPDDRYPPRLLTPQQQRHKTLETLLAMLLAEAAQQPVLFIVEDLHWVDPTTLEWLTLLIDHGPTVPILTVLTCRPEFHPPWGERAHITPLIVPRLSPPEVQTMVARLTGARALPAELLQQLLVKTDGNPLFVEELTKTVLESGVLRTASDRYELAGPLPPLAIPSSLHDALMARLDRLAPVKSVAQLGATLGRQFPYTLLRAVAPLDETALQHALGQLVHAELLYQQGVPPQATYLFKHALIQDAAYQSLLKSTRQQYHQHIAQVLAEHFPETAETQPELLARHYTEAGLAAQALPYWQRAGQRALGRSANLEAIAHLTQGLEVLNTLPDSLERTWQELDVQTTLGPALIATKGFAAAAVEQTYARARELCERVGPTPQLFRVLTGLAMFYLMRGELQTGRKLGEQLLSLAESGHDPELRMLATAGLGSALFLLGEVVAARAHLEQGIVLYDPQHHRAHAFLYGLDHGVLAFSFAAQALWILGYPDQARRRSDEARTLAQELAHLFSRVLTLLMGADVHRLRREWSLAQERAETALTLSTEQGFSLWVARGTIVRGWALAAQGQGEEGMAHMHQGLAAYQATGAKRGQPYFLALLAEAYGNVGRAEAGLRVLAEALAIVRTTGERWGEAEIYRLKGELLLLQATERDGPDHPSIDPSLVAEAEVGAPGRVPLRAEAETCLQQALTMARQQQAKSWELRAAMSLARLWQHQGKRADAYKLLAPIYGWFTEGFDTADLQEAKALLAELA